MAHSTSLAIGLFAVVLAFSVMSGSVAQAHSPVRLADVQTLTLRAGQQTSGRRSSPVPQVKCVGGTAGCNAYTPPVIQCTNKGSDGFDAQWECKADLDNAYRFGETNVACEGYSHPDDPFVLAGSCGVEFTLDLTQEGRDNKARPAQYHSTGGYHNGGSTSSSSRSSSTTTSGDDLGALIFVALILLVVCASCGSNGSTRHHHYNSGGGYGYGSNCHGGYGGGGSGFWTGAAVGSVLGSRSSSSRGRSYFSGGGGGGGGSTGTRTASGFGGTRRR